METVRKRPDDGTGHIPIRTCRACGRKAPKRTLVRLVCRQGMVVEDPGQKMAGRGVYCCSNVDCRQRLEKNKKILERAFRRRF